MEAFTFSTQTFMLVCLLKLKVWVPPREVASCCFFCLVSAETLRTVVLLIALLSLSLFLFNYLRTRNEVQLLIINWPCLIFSGHLWSIDGYCLNQIYLVEFVCSLLCASVEKETTITDKTKVNTAEANWLLRVSKPISSMVTLHNSNFIMYQITSITNTAF